MRSSYLFLHLQNSSSTLVDRIVYIDTVEIGDHISNLESMARYVFHEPDTGGRFAKRNTGWLLVATFATQLVHKCQWEDRCHDPNFDPLNIKYLAIQMYGLHDYVSQKSLISSLIELEMCAALGAIEKCVSKQERMLHCFGDN